MEFLLPLFLCFTCGLGGSNKEYEANNSKSVLLAEKYLAKKKEAKEVFDKDTLWPSTTDCDGTLWAGLAKASGLDVKLNLAEYSPGEIHRRPGTSCYVAGKEGEQESASTISQDMVIGYLWGVWASKDADALRRLAAYGEAHTEKVAGQVAGWVMGSPYPEMASRVLLRPNGVGLVGRLLNAFGENKNYASLPKLYLPVAKDYEKHIMVLGILLEGEAKAGGPKLVEVNDQMFERLKELKDEKDALFQAAWGLYSGEYEAGFDLLLSDSYEYPSYVRGHKNYELVHWLFAAHTILKHRGFP